MFSLSATGHRAAMTYLLILMSGAMLFVPVAEGAQDIKAMVVALTMLAVKDHFSAVTEERKADGPPLEDIAV